MQELDSIFAKGHERVLFVQDSSARYRAIIALHSTALGPAVGGSRFWRYSSADEALADALRLSRGMTFKNAAAGLPFGGGKAVIMAPDGEFDRESLFLAHGRAIEALSGTFITGEDVGTSPSDMITMARATQYAAGYDGRGGDPSPFTARGVLRGIQACAAFRWGDKSLEGRRVAIQGCGNVGADLARLLKQEGAQLTLADVDSSRAESCAHAVDGEVVGPDEVLRSPVDIVAPCALGAILTPTSIDSLRCEVVAGAANNQLANDNDAALLRSRGILYAPDYVVNAGGVISGAQFVLGESLEAVNVRIDSIYDRLLHIFGQAQANDSTTLAAADRYALDRLRGSTA